jgi:hypothetical protein
MISYRPQLTKNVFINFGERNLAAPRNMKIE